VYDALCFGKAISNFLRNLKIETVDSSETSVPVYQNTEVIHCIRGAQLIQKSMGHLKILGAMTVT
jgi:hypothetical protein